MCDILFQPSLTLWHMPNLYIAGVPGEIGPAGAPGPLGVPYAGEGPPGKLQYMSQSVCD
jgi:hypothetical protein